MKRDQTPLHPPGVVRFITCGSVDDGKSTLIGRLLYDTKAVLSDQLQALARTRHARSTAHDAEVDLALLTDGLEAEREQGITIDVAYRYFATAQRKFIVADAPGHEQYTRNMVTGASQADVALLLVDATRVNRDQHPARLLAQTKRHAAIVRLLGLRHLAVVVNKMDLHRFDEKVFADIEQSVLELARTLDLPAPAVFPVSALRGDNVVSRSGQTPWYRGPSLLEWLESLDVTPADRSGALRLPVQWVARQDGSAQDDFRGYLGRIESGSLTPGQRLRVLPSGEAVTVAQLHRSQGEPASSDPAQSQGVPRAVAGDVIALTLEQDVDISRGDLLVSADDASAVLAKGLLASLCWLNREPLSLSRKYILRQTTREVFARVRAIHQVLDIETLSQASDHATLDINGIGQVELALQQPIVADAFDDSPQMGAFVLIDEATHHTVAAGMIRRALP